MGATKEIFNQIKEVEKALGLEATFGGFNKAAAIQWRGQQAKRRNKTRPKRRRKKNNKK